MAYRIVSGRPLAQEMMRLFDEQLIAAAAGLTGADRVVHQARKNVKKARALLQLAQASLGGEYAAADNELRIANRALGPLADAARVCETLDAITHLVATSPPQSSLDAIRVRLHVHAATLSQTAAHDIVARTLRLLASVRRRASGWKLSRLTDTAVAREVRRAHAAARDARRETGRRPTIDGFHRWRRRAKREWHLVRLIADRTGNRLADERHQLAALDACLGQLHDVQVLIDAVATDSPLSRRDTAAVLRALRSAVRDLRRRAHVLAAVLDERPQDLEYRIGALWSAPPRSPGREVRPWRQPA